MAGPSVRWLQQQHSPRCTLQAPVLRQGRHPCSQLALGHCFQCQALRDGLLAGLSHRHRQARQARLHVNPDKDSGDIVPINKQSDAFGEVESRIASTFRQPPGGRDDWQELEHCWVLRPPGGVAATHVVYFLGGAFVGAAPQITYRLFLELLAAQGCAVRPLPVPTVLHAVAAGAI